MLALLLLLVADARVVQTHGSEVTEVAALAPGVRCATRRSCLALALAPLVPAPLLAASGATSGSKGKDGLDEKMDPTVKAAATPEAARAQIQKGYRELGELLQNFDSVTAAEGGDGIRRVLGKVGTTSPVYLIEPAFRLLFERDESLPMEYIEGVEYVMRELSDADGQAYSANFISFSSAKGKPEDYFRRASEAVTRARAKWLELMQLLDLKP